MSIIHEALKKVQSDRSQNKEGPEILKPEGKPADRPSRPSAGEEDLSKAQPAAAVNRPRFAWDTFLWICIALLLSGMTFLNLYQYTARTAMMAALSFPSASIPFPAPYPEQKAAIPVIVSAPEIVPAPSPVPQAPPKPKKGAIILSGITLMDGKNYALINDGIYEIGDEIAGSKITKITSDSVELTHWGTTRTLKVTH